MIEEKTIYICSDGMRFDNKNNAQDYDEDYNKLKEVYDICLGIPLSYPEIREGYCLETRQHTTNHINTIIVEILTRLKNHAFKYNTIKDFDIEFKNVLSLFEKIKNLENSKDITCEFGRLTNKLQTLCYYYMFDDEYFISNYNKSIIYKIVKRLKNTSYVTGIEYLDNSICSWVFREDEWEIFVKREKEYITNGGKYR